MKKIFFITCFILTSIFFNACTKADFEEAYIDPGKVSSTDVDRLFSGIMVTNKDYVLPAYRNYFVTLRTTLNHYTQTTGWANEPGQYVPGSSGTEDIWYNYYNTLAQYRELQKVYNGLDQANQNNFRIYLVLGSIYIYDYTQRIVDVFGAIPFSEAGRLSTNGGDYNGSYAKFDTAESIYTKMLDDLKTFSSELNTIKLNSAFLSGLKTQDLINHGDIELWKRYCNSLRLRMLTRVQDTSGFSSRAKSEMNEILNNSTTYPVVDDNAQNIQMSIYNTGSPINNNTFREAMESGAGWFINTAGKKMIDQLVSTNDPRLPYIFEPGNRASGKYIGIDPMANSTEQANLTNEGKIALYNTSVLVRNKYLPGYLINAAEINLIKAEFYLRNGNDAMAKSAYEAAIAKSIQQYVIIGKLSNDNTIPIPPPPSAKMIADYTSQDMVSWDKAVSQITKTKLIATQKWLHFNIIQAYENWAEQRRMDALSFNFTVDNSSIQTLPPVRFMIPNNETTYNTVNYNLIKDQDKLNSRLFWDIK